MTILWVENQTRFSQVATKHFLMGYAVTVVPSIAAARVTLSQQRFDIVLLDYDLDDGKGTELVSEIKEQSNASPLIATSSHAIGNQLLIQAGADAICSKMEFANIQHIIERLTAKSWK